METIEIDTHTERREEEAKKSGEQQQKKNLISSNSLLCAFFCVCDSTSLSLSNRSLNYLASLLSFPILSYAPRKTHLLLRFVFFSLSSSSSFIYLVKMGRNICNIFIFTYLFYVGVKCFDAL